MSKWPRACAHCSSLVFVRDLFCRECWRELQQLQNRGEQLGQPGYPFPVFSLFLWREEARLTKLFYSLKGGHHRESVRELAAELSLGVKFGHVIPEDLVVVPAPPRNPLGSPDHAALLAMAIAEATGFRYAPLLQRASTGPQKQLSSEERHSLQLARLYESPSPEAVLFVDDIITSGATANAAFKALGTPKVFHVWTLGCRPKRLLV